MSGSLMIEGSSSATAIMDDKKRKEMEQWKGGLASKIRIMIRIIFLPEQGST